MVAMKSRSRSAGEKCWDAEPEIFLANNYERGQYTLNHTDAPYIARPLVVTTLLSAGDIVFGKALRRTAPADEKPEATFTHKPGSPGGSLVVSLPPRSTLYLSGPSANAIQHAINAVPTRRISVLLRRSAAAATAAAR